MGVTMKPYSEQAFETAIEQHLTTADGYVKGDREAFDPVRALFPAGQELFQTRRNLPHWQLGGSNYFVTFRTKALELTPEARTTVLNACRHFGGIRSRRSFIPSSRTPQRRSMIDRLGRRI
jgi:hypothetical protein